MGTIGRWNVTNGGYYKMHDQTLSDKTQLEG